MKDFYGDGFEAWARSEGWSPLIDWDRNEFVVRQEVFQPLISPEKWDLFAQNAIQIIPEERISLTVNNPLYPAGEKETLSPLSVNEDQVRKMSDSFCGTSTVHDDDEAAQYHYPWSDVDDEEYQPVISETFRTKVRRKVAEWKHAAIYAAVFYAATLMNEAIKRDQQRKSK